MALNRITGLGVIALGTSMLVALACDSGGTTSGPGGSQGGSSSQNTNATGGTSSGNTDKATGGAISSSTGGEKATGGAASTSPSTGVSIANNCATPTSESGSFTITGGNYFKVGPYGGYGFVYISPTTNAADSITCKTASFGTTTNALCGAGIVPPEENYNAVGGIGFNLNQSTAGGTGSNKPITSPATVSQVVVTFANTANTGLHIQIVQNSAGGDTGGKNYCYDAKGKSSPLTLNASDFTTTCWGDPNNTANPLGDPWDGTNAQSFQFVIPSDSTTPTPFDACIENVEFS